MRKLAVWLLVPALAATMLTVLTGCGGGDTGKAKEYMDAGDEKMEEANLSYDEALSRLQLTIVTLSSGSGDLQAEGLTLQGYLQEVANCLNAAEAEYQKILGLSGAEDYKTYADLSLEFIAMFEGHLAAAKALLDQVTVELQSGTVTDVAAYLDALVAGPEFAELDARGDAMDIQEKEGKDFKKEKDL